MAVSRKRKQISVPFPTAQEVLATLDEFQVWACTDSPARRKVVTKTARYYAQCAERLAKQVTPFTYNQLLKRLKHWSQIHSTAFLACNGFLAFWQERCTNSAPKPTPGEPLAIMPVPGVTPGLRPELPESKKTVAATYAGDPQQMVEALSKIEGVDNVVATADGTQITYTMSVPKNSPLAAAITAGARLKLVPATVVPADPDKVYTEADIKRLQQEIELRVLGMTPNQQNQRMSDLGRIIMKELYAVLEGYFRGEHLDYHDIEKEDSTFADADANEIKRRILGRLLPVQHVLWAVDGLYEEVLQDTPPKTLSTEQRFTKITQTLRGKSSAPAERKPGEWQLVMLALLHSRLEPDCPLPMDVDDQSPASVHQALTGAIGKVTHRHEAMQSFIRRLLERLSEAFPELGEIKWEPDLSADDVMDTVYQIRAGLGEGLVENTRKETFRDVAEVLLRLQLPPDLPSELLRQQIEHRIAELLGRGHNTEELWQTLRAVVKRVLGAEPAPTSTLQGIQQAVDDKITATINAARLLEGKIDALGKGAPPHPPIEACGKSQFPMLSEALAARYIEREDLKVPASAVDELIKAVRALKG